MCQKNCFIYICRSIVNEPFVVLGLRSDLHEYADLIFRKLIASMLTTNRDTVANMLTIIRHVVANILTTIRDIVTNILTAIRDIVASMLTCTSDSLA